NFVFGGRSKRRPAVTMPTVEKQGAIVKLHAIVLSTSLLVASHGVFAAPFAYVPNEESGTISVIDTQTDTVVKTIKAGKKPRGIATGKASNTLYVSNQPNNSLLIVDLEHQKVVDSIDLGESPEGVGMSADGKLVAAAVELSNSIALIDTATKKRVANIKVQGK